MLRITLHDEVGSATLQLEGKLVGPWAQEAQDSWRRAHERKPVQRIDLTGVTMIDAAGKAFLSMAYAQKVQMVASGCLMRAIVAQIGNTPDAGCGCQKSRNEEEGLKSSLTKVQHEPSPR
jgi:hypothetical protein